MGFLVFPTPPSSFVTVLLAAITGLWFLISAWISDGTSTRTRWIKGVVGIGCLVGALLLTLRLPNPSATFALLIMPAGILWIVGLTSMVFLYTRRQTRAGTMVLFAWIFYTLMGSSVVGNLLLRLDETPFTAIDPFSTSYDAVAVLGGGTATRQHYHYLGASGDRIMLGARLWYEGHTPLLITTGSTASNARQQHDSSSVTRRIWEQIGIPSSAILHISSPTNTRQEMEVLATYQKQYGWQRLGVISSARHLPRVMRNAERLDLRIYPLPADYRTSDGLFPIGLRGIVPSSVGFDTVQLAFWEWLARAVGH